VVKNSPARPPLFSFLGWLGFQVRSKLVGGMINEQIVGQLSPLRQVVARRFLEKDAAFNSQNGKMPRMRQPKALERWEKESVFWRNAALLVSRMRSSFFSMVAAFSSILPFFAVVVCVFKVLEVIYVE
jgi:hypothetical protein